MNQSRLLAGVATIVLASAVFALRPGARPATIVGGAISGFLAFHVGCALAGAYRRIAGPPRPLLVRTLIVGTTGGGVVVRAAVVTIAAAAIPIWAFSTPWLSVEALGWLGLAAGVPAALKKVVEKHVIPSESGVDKLVVPRFRKDALALARAKDKSRRMKAAYEGRALDAFLVALVFFGIAEKAWPKMRR